MFPGPHARIYRNEAGEVLGWDYPSDDDPADVDDYYDRDIYDEPAYCDYCEREGHTFRTCPNRDDDLEEVDA